jgi:hypothetical protein
MKKFDNKRNQELAISAPWLFSYDKISDENIKDKDVLLIRIPFDQLLIIPDLYNDLFESDNFVKSILSCSGACSLKHSEFEEYMIIINSNEFDKLNDETQKFIIAHELGHICHGECDPSFKGLPDEYFADHYAISKGYHIKDSPLKLALFESFSLIPHGAGKTYLRRLKLFFIRLKVIFEHLHYTRIRKESVYKKAIAFNSKKRLQEIIYSEIQKISKRN